MYTSFFGLNEKPFSITPDPRYLFMSERHGEALAHLVYGVTESGGFIQLTGEVGTGKTTLCRSLLLNRMPGNADVAVVLNPQLSAPEFLEAICEELSIDVPSPGGSIKALINTLNEHLLSAHAEGRRTILIVDEAQNLAPEVLEEVRLLTNLETSKQKLLQIILIGQPELRELLARNDLRQLAQRITGRYHLEPLTRDETDQYIEHRLQVAGALGEVFDAGAKRAVFKLSQGVPRLINVICDRALLGAYSQGMRIVDRRLVHRATREITGEPELDRGWKWTLPVTTVTVAAMLLIAALVWFNDNREVEIATQPAQVAAPAESTPAPEPGPESEEEEYVSLDEQLAMARELSRRDSALATLFQLWSIDLGSATTTACEHAQTMGYSCLSDSTSWSGLRRLNRPAVLELVDQSGDAHYVVLTQMLGEQAELSIGGVIVTHPVGVIADMWFGDYQLIWQPPNGVSVSLQPGVQNSNVIWLRQSLAAIDPQYRAEPVDSDIYDQTLEQQVRAFQRDRRLDVDGLAGKQTQIIINSLLESDNTPRLTVPQLAQE
ncbi:MAG: AAA family ATPase [Woeseiaceae bacterium]